MKLANYYLVSHAGLFRGALRLSLQTPAQPRTTFLSHCFIREVRDQSTIVKKGVDRLSTTHKLVVV